MWNKIICALIGLTVIVVFVLNVRCYYFLSEDCFISFRYARNLVDGNGLVWNPGERVEGYTNFLWVLILALGMRVHIEPEIMSNIIGIASGVILLGVLLIFGARRFGWTHPLVWAMLLILALSRTFTGWCT